MDKTAIKNFAIEARKILMKTAVNRAGFYGITCGGISEPIQKGPDFEIYKTVAGTENRIFGSDIKRRRNLVAAIKEKGFDEVIEETAYTWFNRLIAIRFMEVNDYLPTRTRVLSSETGNNTPDIVSQYLDVDLNMSENEIEKVRSYIENNKYDDAFQSLFVKQCNELNDILPGLFEKTDDYMELLLDICYTSDGVIKSLIDTVEEGDFDVEKEGQVEIIGWMYQYYNTEPKERIINVLKGSTIKKEEIPAATQLFTTDWVVKYIVDNSVGRYWIERNPNSNLAEKLEYFVKPKTGDIKYIDKKIEPEDIDVLDNCMGSGHFLVYAIDVLMMIYEECGYNERDAIQSILKNNIYGLDIDQRAFQLAYFAVVMKARQYDRRFFAKKIMPQVYEIKESNGISASSYDWMKAEYREIAEYLCEVFYDAKEYGSIIKVENKEYEKFIDYCNKWFNDREISVQTYMIEPDIKMLIILANQAKTMGRQYTSVVTNPPYMNRYDAKLKKYLNDNYKDYSGDLFSVFMVRNFENCKPDGYTGLMTPYVWMFIKNYELLRKHIIDHKNITSLIQFEYSAFEEATVPICAVVMNNTKLDGKGYYIKLSDFVGGMDVQRIKTLEALNNDLCKYFYEISQNNYNYISGCPIAFWASKEVFDIFYSSRPLSTIAAPKDGLHTGDNNRFLRIWSEVNYDSIGFGLSDSKETIIIGKKWYPVNKGGSYRKWYGNNDYVINWENDGYEIRNFKNDKGKLRSRPQNIQWLFKDGLTYSDVTSGGFSMRVFDHGFAFDTSGPSMFIEKNGYNKLYLAAFMNSKCAAELLKMVSPTLHYQAGAIAKIPIKYDRKCLEKIIRITRQNVELSKSDWDSFETSWDFERHPLISVISKNRNGFEDFNCIELKDCFAYWKNECKERFYQLKRNEEELNVEFIDIYGLQDELTSEVDDKEVTVRKAELSRDIKSLISFAVGCMFGRYSLDEKGIVYAGGVFDKDRYKSFSIDDDAIIPITDEDYFDDDIVKRFEEFIKIVFGEKSLEINLNYIADALGNKGKTSREVIRNYFLNDFFKDHCNTYSVTGSGKRPIYWLFDSGKQNGFKCLIYMHRYTPDIVGLIRSTYFRKTQDAIENAMKNAEYVINTTPSAVEKAAATKKRDKYIKQLNEMRPYYQALTHIALQRIDIDLDDGVKHNYQLFQGVEISGEGTKKQKIDLLAKI